MICRLDSCWFWGRWLVGFSTARLHFTCTYFIHTHCPSVPPSYVLEGGFPMCSSQMVESRLTELFKTVLCHVAKRYKDGKERTRILHFAGMDFFLFSIRPLRASGYRKKERGSHTSRGLYLLSCLHPPALQPSLVCNRCSAKVDI